MDSAVLMPKPKDKIVRGDAYFRLRQEVEEFY